MLQRDLCAPSPHFIQGFEPGAALTLPVSRSQLRSSVSPALRWNSCTPAQEAGTRRQSARAPAPASCASPRTATLHADHPRGLAPGTGGIAPLRARDRLHRASQWQPFKSHRYKYSSCSRALLVTKQVARLCRLFQGIVRQRTLKKAPEVAR